MMVLGIDKLRKRVETLENEVDDLKKTLKWVGISPDPVDMYINPDVQDIRQRQEMLVEYLGIEVKCTPQVDAMCKYVKKEEDDGQTNTSSE